MAQRIDSGADVADELCPAGALADGGRAKNGQIRVLIADDHSLFRRGLQMILQAEEGISVVAEAEDGEDALAKTEEFAPDVVVMDVRMPRLNGIEATRRIRQRHPEVKVVVLTISDGEDDLYDAIKAGATGYLLKEVSIAEVVDAVRVAVEGQSHLSTPMTSKLIAEFNNVMRRAEAKDQLSEGRLTEREIEVLGLVAQGMSNREIANTLYISENTVKNHVRNILEKLHLHSRTEAVVYALREKLLEIH